MWSGYNPESFITRYVVLSLLKAKYTSQEKTQKNEYAVLNYCSIISSKQSKCSNMHSLSSDTTIVPFGSGNWELRNCLWSWEYSATRRHSLVSIGKAGTQSGDSGCAVVTLLSHHAQSLCRATQSGRDHTQSGFWRCFYATQSGLSVTVRDLARRSRHTVRPCRTQSVDYRTTQSDCVAHSRSFPSDCVGT